MPFVAPSLTALGGEPANKVSGPSVGGGAATGVISMIEMVSVALVEISVWSNHPGP